MKNVFILLLFLTTAFSCTKIIELDLNDADSQKLVVDAWFTTKAKEHEIKLTLTTSYFQNEVAPKAAGATVYVTDGVNQINFTEVTPGIYKTVSTAKAEYNTSYTLHIEYGGEVYESVAYADTVAKLDSIAAEVYIDVFGDPDGFSINMWTQELPGKGDHYLWRLYKNNELLTDTLNEIYFETDEYLPDGLYFSNWPVEYVDGASGDSITLEQHRISKETFDGFTAMMLETDWRGGIFDSPPANVPTNISNGAVGLFVVSAETENSCVIP